MKMILWNSDSERLQKSPKCKMSGTFQSSFQQKFDPPDMFKLFRSPPFFALAGLYSILQVSLDVPMHCDRGLQSC